MRDRLADKAFLPHFLKIALPVAGQNLINFAVSVADTVMIGQLGEVELAAVSQANQLGFVLMLLMFGLGSGSNVLIAQYWGKRDVASIRRVMTVMYRILLSVSVLFTALAVLSPEWVMGFFTRSPAVIEAGARYLRIVGWSYALNCFTIASVSVLRSVGAVNFPLVVYLSSLVVNVFLNWVLIFGHFGMPAMGVRGGAIATVCARVVELILAAFFVFRYEKTIRYRPKMLVSLPVGRLNSFLRIAVPVICNEFLWGVSAAVLNGIVGKIGTEFSAAYAISAVVTQMVFIAFGGAGNAAAVVIGNTVGAGEHRLAGQRAGALMLVALVLGAFAIVVVLLVRGPLPRMYNISELARRYAGQLMTVQAAVSFLQSFTMVSMMGILRGGGDVRFVAVLDLAPTWLLAIPLGMLGGFVWHWPPPAVYAALRIDELVKVLLVAPRLLAGGWIRDVTVGKPD